MRITHFAALISISLLTSAALHAQDIKPLDTTDHFCVEDEAYVVSNSRANVHVSGPCTDVTVTGSNNTVMIDLTGAIHVSGDNNQIEWVAVLGKTEAPTIQNNGNQNTVERAKNR